MDLELGDKVALITGGSRGIGLACAKMLAEQGSHVAICARDEATLERASALTGATPFVADVTHSEQVTSLIASVIERFGRLDILVNNVGGSGGAGSFAETDRVTWDRVLQTNLGSAAEVTRQALPHLRRGAAIVNVASIWGREWGGAASYMTAKAALIALTKSLSRELAPKGVRVNSVAPGPILFPGGSWSRRLAANEAAVRAYIAGEVPLGRFGEPEEVARVVAFLASPAASYITGVCVPVDGGMSRSLI